MRRFATTVFCHHDCDIDDRVVSCWARHNHAYTAATTIAIIDTAIALQRLVQDNASALHEIEINPLICRATDAVAADALIRMEE